MREESGDDAFAAANSGRGHRCVGTSALVAFSDDLTARGAWIDIVETFEMTVGSETPRIDLGIYGDHGCYDRPAAERRGLAAERLRVMLAAVSKESAVFSFTVWLDRED